MWVIVSVADATGADGRTAAEGVASRDAQPAANWNEALPLGNGRIGAMVFGGPRTERLQLNEETTCNGMTYDVDMN